MFNLQAVTGDARLSRGSRAKKSLEQCLNDIRSMVPTILDTKVCTKYYVSSHVFFIFLDRINDVNFACRYLR